MSNLKMRPEHYETLKTAMLAKWSTCPDITPETYREQEIGKDHAMRFRWDLCYASVTSRWICDTLYPTGLNDTHIDSALRQIIREA